MKNRKIIHIDMDAFFASIEQRDDKSLKGKPVIVGRHPNQRGVVATCSYEARKYGVHSAMSMKLAQRICPNGTIVQPRYSVYQETSEEIHNIFLEKTKIMEPVALDEAYLDVTECCQTFEEATQIALTIKTEIRNRLSLTCSAGVSYNKFLAKLASEYNKPNGFFLIRETEAQKFIDNLKIREFYGIGKVTEAELKNYGVDTGKDLRQYSLEELTRFFHKRGYFLYQFARGIDDREVKNKWERKSIGHEVTFETDISSGEMIIYDKLDKITQYLEQKMIENGKCGSIVTLVVKSDSFVEFTRRIGVSKPIYQKNDIMEICKRILDTTQLPVKIRLLGVRISKLEEQSGVYENISIFDILN